VSQDDHQGNVKLLDGKLDGAEHGRIGHVSSDADREDVA
jgi:hypothetical protein